MNFSNINNFLRKTLKFGIYLPITNLAFVYGRNLFKQDTLFRISQKRNRIIQNKVLKYLPPKNSGITIQTPTKLVNDAIWVCWLQGENKMPELAKICLQSIRHNSNGHQVILLTTNNYNQYVQLPDIALRRYENRQISHAHFADIIRMNLLTQQGGLWLDATMLITAPIDESIFTRSFFSIKTKPSGYFVSECRWAVFALACQRNNMLMAYVSKAFENYLKDNDILIDYFLFDHFIDMMCKQLQDLNKMVNDIPFNNPEVHGLREWLISPYNVDQMKTLSKETSMFKLNSRTFSEEQLASSRESFYKHFRNQYLND